MAGGLQPSSVGQESCNVSEGTIGKWGKFTYCSPDLFDVSGRKFTASLNLKSSYVHGLVSLVLVEFSQDFL